MAKAKKTKGLVSSIGANATPQSQALSTPAEASSLYKELMPIEAYSLVPDVRNAIDLRAINLSKAKPRLFNEDGDEIVDHPILRLLKNPCPYVSYTSFIEQMEIFFGITGERLLWKVNGDRTDRIEVLNPSFAQPDNINVSNPEYIKHWMYSGRLGPSGVKVQLPAKLMMYSRVPNPNLYIIRGLSPLITLSTAASLAYYMDEFNAAFFKNDTQIGSVILRFPKTTPDATVKAVTAQFESRHGISSGKGFKVVGLRGDEIQVEKTATDIKEGHFVELSKLKIQQIYSCLGIPRSMAGYGDSTTALAQSQVVEDMENCWENRLLPSLLSIQDFFQTQLVDPAGYSSIGYAKSKGVMGRQCKRVFQRAMDTRQGKGVVLLLDPDSIPIVAKLRYQQILAAKELSNTLAISPKESLTHFGLNEDFEDRPERDLIYIPISLEAQGKKEEVKPVEPVVVPTEEDILTEEEKAVLNDFWRKYRKSVLSAAESGEMYLKMDLGNIPERFKHIVSLDYNPIRKILSTVKESADRVIQAKAILNKHSIKRIIKGSEK